MTRQKHKITKAVFTASLLASIFFSGCADIFQDRVPMQPVTNTTTLLTLFSVDKNIEKLDAPKQVFVTNGEYNNKIIVTWKAVDGAASYCLERAISHSKDAHDNWIAPDDGAYEPLEHSKFVEGTTFTDTIIDNSPSNLLDYTNQAYNCAYFYRICAENMIKNYESSDYTYTTAGTLLAPPTNVKATCGASKDSITVTWKRGDNNVKGYKIYRSTNEDASGSSRVADVYGNETSKAVGVSAEQQGASLYFTVVSIGSNGSESVASSVAMGYTLKEGSPSQPKEVTIVMGRGETNNSFQISWKKSSGGTGTIFYRVYRSSNSDSTLKLLNKDGSGVSASADTCSYEDKSALKPNTFYYYQVLAFCNRGTDEELKSQMSDSGNDAPTAADVAEAYLVSPPQSITIQRIPGNIAKNTITFSAAIGSDNCVTNTDITNAKADWKTYSYAVYGSDSVSALSTAATLIATFTSPNTSSERGYYEETVQSFKFYKMTTSNGSVVSESSVIVAPAPNAAKNLITTKNTSLSGLTNNDANANANGVHAIKLTWQAPDGGADGGYNIYRSTKATSGFKKINESPITETSYIYKDEQAKAGNYYYYRILSLNSLGQGANYSNTDYGYGALTTYQYVREYIKTTLNSQKKLTLMHKSGNTAKLGTETANGAISGTLSYDAHVSGVSGRVIMEYKNYADFYIMDDKSLGVYFLLNGNTNTSAGMDTNGTMDGTVTVKGMYPGSVSYNAIKIKGGAAGGGTYGVTRNLTKEDGSTDSLYANADWTWGEK